MAENPRKAMDIKARQAQIVGAPQRIAPLGDDELTPEALKLSTSIRAAFGAPETNDLPNVFATMLKHPGLFEIQLNMGIQLAGKGAIPPRERELAILRNAWLCGAPYEWGEHVDISKRHGVNPDEIERCTEGSTAEGWTDHERAILKAVEELHASYTLSNETWDALAQSWNEQQLMEFPVLIGQYISTALLQNTLRVRLADDNPGLGYR